MSISGVKQQFLKVNKWNPLIFLVFLYFLTLSADQLNFQIFLFKPKLNHLIAAVLFAILFFAQRIRIQDRRLILCFVGLISSVGISSLFSCLFFRSLGYVAITVFTYVGYFVVPLSLMQLLDKDKLLRVYMFSFFLIGAHAASQVILSLFGIDPFFVLQSPILGSLVRGQSWTYEPSFYALYAIPFVFFITSNYLLSCKIEKRFSSLIYVLIANVFLLASVSTSAFFSYFVFFLAALFFCGFQFRKLYFPGFFKKLITFIIGFGLVFYGVGLCFSDLFLVTFYKFIYIGLFQDSFLVRWEGIIAACETFLLYPFFGLGIGGVGPFLYMQRLFSTTDIELEQVTLDEIEPFDPTNVFTEVLASLGIYGLLVFSLVGLFFLKIFLSALNNPLLNQKERRTIFSLLISVVIMILCLQINQGLFRSYVWVHMGISLGYVLKANACSIPDNF